MWRAMLGACALVAANAVAAAEWRETIGDWDVHAGLSAAGAPLCYAASDRGRGERLVFVRTADRVFLILRRETWRLEGERTTVALRIDAAPPWAQPAQVDRHAIVLDWRREDPLLAALRQGQTLDLEVAGLRAVRVDLAGSAAALAAADECFAQAGRGHDRETAHGRDPLREAPGDAVDRPALARHLTTWLEAAAPEHGASVDVAGEHLPLMTVFGAGAVVLLEGRTHAAVVAAGRAVFAERTGAAVRLHDRHDINGYLVARLSAGMAEAVVVSYRDDPGGMLVWVEPKTEDVRARDFTAAVVEEIAEREGLVLRLRSPAAAS